MTETLDISYSSTILILYQLFDSFSEVFTGNPSFEKWSFTCSRPVEMVANSVKVAQIKS